MMFGALILSHLEHVFLLQQPQLFCLFRRPQEDLRGQRRFRLVHERLDDALPACVPVGNDGADGVEAQDARVRHQVHHEGPVEVGGVEKVKIWIGNISDTAFKVTGCMVESLLNISSHFNAPDRQDRLRRRVTCGSLLSK